MNCDTAGRYDREKLRIGGGEEVLVPDAVKKIAEVRNITEDGVWSLALRMSEKLRTTVLATLDYLYVEAKYFWDFAENA